VDASDGGSYGTPGVNVEGNQSKQSVTVHYAYNDQGQMVKTGGRIKDLGNTEGGTYGVGTMWSSDAFGNVTDGTIRQDYDIMNNQAKLVSNRTDTYSVSASGVSSYEDPGANWEGTKSKQSVTVIYGYYTASGSCVEPRCACRRDEERDWFRDDVDGGLAWERDERNDRPDVQHY